MRISNPPAGAGSSVVVSSINAPNTYTTMTPISFTSGTPAAFAADSTVFEHIFSNLDPVAVVYARDSAATTNAAGVAIQPLATAVINTQAAVTLTTGSATAVAVTHNVTRNV